MKNLIDKKPEVFDRKKSTFIVGFLFSMFHFTIGFRNAVESTFRDGPKVVIMPLKELYHSGSFRPWLFQENFYTGNTFFGLPYFLLFESSPYSLRIFLIGIMALGTFFAFLSYAKLFDLKKAILGGMLLISVNSWLLFREADYTYMAVFPTICLYFFIKWDVEGKIRDFYILSFLSGLLFYFKASVAYIMIALVLGKFFTCPKQIFSRILNDIGIKKLVKSGLLFLTGLSPFLFYLFNNPEVIFLSVGDQSLNLTHNFLRRSEQLSGMLHPTSAFKTGLISINPISLGLIVSILISLISRNKIDYTLSFLLFFGTFLLTPQISGFMYGHIFTLIPFVPIVILAAYETCENLISQYNATAAKILYLVIIFILATNISASALWIEDQDTLRLEPSPQDQQPRYIDLRENKTELDSTVYTNTHQGAIYALYDFNVRDVYFIGERDNPLVTGGYDIGFDRLQIEDKTLEEANLSSKSVLLLAKDLECGSNKRCFDVNYILKHVNNTDFKLEDNLVIRDKDYEVYRRK